MMMRNNGFYYAPFSCSSKNQGWSYHYSSSSTTGLQSFLLHECDKPSPSCPTTNHKARANKGAALASLDWLIQSPASLARVCCFFLFELFEPANHKARANKGAALEGSVSQRRVDFPKLGGAGGVAVSPSHRDREGHGFESHWSPQQ